MKCACWFRRPRLLCPMMQRWSLRQPKPRRFSAMVKFSFSVPDNSTTYSATGANSAPFNSAQKNHSTINRTHRTNHRTHSIIHRTRSTINRTHHIINKIHNIFRWDCFTMHFVNSLICLSIRFVSFHAINSHNQCASKRYRFSHSICSHTLSIFTLCLFTHTIGFRILFTFPSIQKFLTIPRTTPECRQNNAQFFHLLCQ